jgi:glycosyltransferase involved in cell wall biosynthesis
MSASVSFSVVVPCHNAARYLRETLATALGQSHAPLEVLVVDDGSTDDSCAIVEEQARGDARVRLLHTPAPTGGPSIPRNLGIAAARGAYVALLDADDLWGPEKLARDAAFLARHAVDVDVLFSGAYTFVDTPDVVRSVMPSKPIGRRFQVKNHVPTSSIVIRRAYAETLSNVFDPDPLMRIEDYHFLLNAYFSGARLRNRPGIDTYYRYHAVSRVQRRDLGEALRRQYYNLSKLALLHRLSAPRVYMLSGAVTLRLLRSWVRQR